MTAPKTSQKRPSIKSGTWNFPGDLGTSKNYNYDEKYAKLNKEITQNDN